MPNLNIHPDKSVPAILREPLPDSTTLLSLSLAAGEQSNIGDFCVSVRGKADIEGSNSNFVLKAWLPQTNYP